MKDLFEKRSDKDRLWDWMLEQKYIKTSMVIKWGVYNFSNRALRNSRELANEHKDIIRKLEFEEKERLFGRIKEDVWAVEIT